MARTTAAQHQGGPRRPSRKLSESLAATGSTVGFLKAKSGFVCVQGTWAGTINIEVDPSETGSWSNLTDLTGAAIAFTGNFNVAFDNGASIKTRVKFTRTSGTAVVVLTAD